MNNSVVSKATNGHRVIPEIDRPMLKADLRKAESDDSLKELGECLDFARRSARWTLDQLAANMPPPPGSEKRDPRQVQRWIDGKERTQVDTVFAVPELRQPFVIALAKLAECDVETTVLIRMKESA